MIVYLPAPVLADERPKDVEVLERDAQGGATKVKFDGFVMDVCTPEKTDGCVNPREIGLDQGNRAIDYWPGKPASEIDRPLPEEQSGDEKDEK
ncbi:MAG: hypothetical protein H6917_12025 [Novosphingobium sp.]|nr:hypothetical protein [Novosphingobium sp.]MCP5403099.1 hypothetical protein [Novosphingobium sp.]